MIQTYLKAFGVPLSSATFLPSNGMNANNTIKNVIIVALTTVIVGVIIYSIHQYNKSKVERVEV